VVAHQLKSAETIRSKEEHGHHYRLRRRDHERFAAVLLLEGVKESFSRHLEGGERRAWGVGQNCGYLLSFILFLIDRKVSLALSSPPKSQPNNLSGPLLSNASAKKSY
jgi:hypothetical protein